MKFHSLYKPSTASIYICVQTNWGETFKYLKNAEKYLAEQEIKQTYLPRGVYVNMSEAFLMINQIDSALFYIQKAELITKKEQDPFGYSRILSNYGNIYSKKGDIDLAEVYYKKGITFSDSTHETINLIENLNGLSALLLKIDKSESAKQYGLRSFNENAKSLNKVGVLNLSIVNLLKQAYHNLSKYDSAYYYANLSESYRDTIYNEQSLNAIQDMTFQQKISETEQEAQKQKDEEGRKHLLQYIIIGIGLVSFIVLSLALSNTSIFHYNAVGFLSVVVLLLIFEFINLLLHPVLDKLTHHSPILIFLILVCIASLLVPFHHKLEKWVKDKLVAKNKEIHLANARKTIEKLSNTSKENVE